MKNVPALILGVLAFALAGCEPAPSIPDATLGAFERAFNAGDAAAVAAVYTADATVMPPNMPAIKGRAAIEKYWSDGLAQGPAKISLAQDEFFTMGDAAVRRGTYRLTGADGAQIEAGKYVEVWRRTQDKWELCIDIWNADAAPAMPTPPASPEAPPAPSPG